MRQRLQHGFFIRNVSLNQVMAFRIKAFQIIRVAGVSERVEIYDLAGGKTL
jgi:hypothetical protein